MKKKKKNFAGKILIQIALGSTVHVEVLEFSEFNLCITDKTCPLTGINRRPVYINWSIKLKEDYQQRLRRLTDGLDPPVESVLCSFRIKKKMANSSFVLTSFVYLNLLHLGAATCNFMQPI